MPLNSNFENLLLDRSSEPLNGLLKVLREVVDDGTRGLLRIHQPDSLTHILRGQLFGTGMAALRQLIDLSHGGQ